MIDPENVLNEIHEDNNIGFVPLRVQNATRINKEPGSPLAQGLTLYQNYPNPFNPSTTITFKLTKAELAELSVFDVLGRKVTTLVSHKLNPGIHTYRFDGRNLASGIYFCLLNAGTYREVKKMILIR
jgi:hypothetical protein